MDVFGEAEVEVVFSSDGAGVVDPGEEVMIMEGGEAEFLEQEVFYDETMDELGAAAAAAVAEGVEGVDAKLEQLSAKVGAIIKVMEKKVEAARPRTASQSGAVEQPPEFRVLEKKITAAHHLQELQQIFLELEVIRGKAKHQEDELKSRGQVFKEKIYQDITTILETEFSCVVCSEVFIQPTVIDCGHTFCSYCIQQWCREKMECPICRQAVVSTCTKHVEMDNFVTKIHTLLSQDAQNRRKEVIVDRETLVQTTQETLRNRRAAAAASAAAAAANLLDDDGLAIYDVGDEYSVHIDGNGGIYFDDGSGRIQFRRMPLVNEPPTDNVTPPISGEMPDEALHNRRFRFGGQSAGPVGRGRPSFSRTAEVILTSDSEVEDMDDDDESEAEWWYNRFRNVPATTRHPAINATTTNAGPTLERHGVRVERYLEQANSALPSSVPGVAQSRCPFVRRQQQELQQANANNAQRRAATPSMPALPTATTVYHFGGTDTITTTTATATPGDRNVISISTPRDTTGVVSISPGDRNGGISIAAPTTNSNTTTSSSSMPQSQNQGQNQNPQSAPNNGHSNSHSQYHGFFQLPQLPPPSPVQGHSHGHDGHGHNGHFPGCGGMPPPPVPSYLRGHPFAHLRPPTVVGPRVDPYDGRLRAPFPQAPPPAHLPSTTTTVTTFRINHPHPANPTPQHQQGPQGLHGQGHHLCPRHHTTPCSPHYTYTTLTGGVAIHGNGSIELRPPTVSAPPGGVGVGWVGVGIGLGAENVIFPTSQPQPQPPMTAQYIPMNYGHGGPGAYHPITIPTMPLISASHRTPHPYHLHHPQPQPQAHATFRYEFGQSGRQQGPFTGATGVPGSSYIPVPYYPVYPNPATSSASAAVATTQAGSTTNHITDFGLPSSPTRSDGLGASAPELTGTEITFNVNGSVTCGNCAVSQGQGQDNPSYGGGSMMQGQVGTQSSQSASVYTSAQGFDAYNRHIPVTTANNGDAQQPTRRRRNAAVHLINPSQLAAQARQILLEREDRRLRALSRAHAQAQAQAQAQTQTTQGGQDVASQANLTEGMPSEVETDSDFD